MFGWLVFFKRAIISKYLIKTCSQVLYLDPYRALSYIPLLSYYFISLSVILAVD